MRPQKPFAEWIKAYDDKKFNEEDIISSSTLYMVDGIEDVSPQSIRKHMETVYRDIFIHELWSWYTDEDYFPKNITFKMLEEWCDYEFIDMCFDTVGTKIVME